MWKRAWTTRTGKETDIQIRQGYQSLDGENALGYVRYIDKRMEKSTVSSGRSVS